MLKVYYLFIHQTVNFEHILCARCYQELSCHRLSPSSGGLWSWLACWSVPRLGFRSPMLTVLLCHGCYVHHIHTVPGVDYPSHINTLLGVGCHRSSSDFAVTSSNWDAFDRFVIIVYFGLGSYVADVRQKFEKFIYQSSSSSFSGRWLQVSWQEKNETSQHCIIKSVTFR